MNNPDGWLALHAGSIALLAMIVTLLSAALLVGLVTRMRRLESHYRVLTAGTQGGNLEDVLERHVHQLQAATSRTLHLESAVRALERNSRQHVQHVGFLRFNPFRETGGDQSFVLALADGEGNGAVVSTLHSRDLTRVYAKPLAGWQSIYPLTEEEQQVIFKARNGHAIG